MRLKCPSAARLALLAFVIVPLAAWAIVKPVRVLVPGVGKTTCVSESVCVDDISKADEATRLYFEALAYVAGDVAPVRGYPKVIFCSSEKCAESYGLGARSAVTVGTFGTVIGPRAWHPYYVRHELIHYLQSERFGVIPLLLKPSWFVEGMAYALSQDPRAPLAEPFEGYRSRFLSWYGAIEKGALWREAGRL